MLEVNDSEGTLIPAGEDITHFDVDDELTWVLVVEKEVCALTVLLRGVPKVFIGCLSNPLPPERRRPPFFTRARTYYHRVYPLSRYTDAFLTALRNRARGTPMSPRASSSRRYQTISRPSKYRISWYELDTTIAISRAAASPSSPWSTATPSA